MYVMLFYKEMTGLAKGKDVQLPFRTAEASSTVPRSKQIDRRCLSPSLWFCKDTLCNPLARQFMRDLDLVAKDGSFKSLRTAILLTTVGLKIVGRNMSSGGEVGILHQIILRTTSHNLCTFLFDNEIENRKSLIHRLEP